jgi:hypothetical protein
MNKPFASRPEDIAESAAGEEDPGSAIDIAEVPAKAPMKPNANNDKPAVTPASGEDNAGGC